MCPDDVVPLRERGVDASKHDTAIETPFPDSSVNQFRGWVPFQAHLDFLAAPFLSRINDQRADVLSDVEYNLFGIDTINIHLDHLICSILIKYRDIGRYREPQSLHPRLSSLYELMGYIVKRLLSAWSIKAIIGRTQVGET